MFGTTLGQGPPAFAPQPPRTPQPSLPGRLVSFVREARPDGSWLVRLDLELSFPSTTLPVAFYLRDFPLGGAWNLYIKSNGNRIDLAIAQRAPAPGQRADKVDAHMRMSVRDRESSAVVVEGRPGIWREQGRNGWTLNVTKDLVQAAVAADPVAVHRTTKAFTLDVTLSERAERASTENLERAFRLPDSHASPVNNNVRLFFPDVGPTGAELWTSSHLLSFSSPFLRAQLDSAQVVTSTASTGRRTIKVEDDSSFVGGPSVGLAREDAPRVVKHEEADETVLGVAQRLEGAPVVIVRGKTGGLSDEQDVDSDDETDRAFVAPRLPRTLVDVERLGSNFSYRELVVGGSGYSTWRAVVRYLETGFIRFAPLLSACRPADPTSSNLQHRTVLIERISANWPAAAASLPVLVSPKSTYRLAVRLDLPDLQRVCLANLEMQLPHANAPAELFGATSRTDATWRAVVVKFLAERWDVVFGTLQWDEALAGIERLGVGGGGLAIVNEVLKAREAARRRA
ncbi:hypothetical protein JCM8208_006972 [Rhodotorula glutinis]